MQVREVFRTMMQRVTDPARRARLLWGATCWAIAFILLVFGIGYLVGGLHFTATPGAFEVLTRYVPGDLHTYGAIGTALGLALVHGLLPPVHGLQMIDPWLRRVLLVVGGYCFLLVWLFAWSWVLSGTPTWTAMAYWGSESGLALAAAHWGPGNNDRPGRVP